MKENIIQIKSYDFAVRIVNLYKYLTKKFNEYALFVQIMKSGTSIGANIEEAEGGQTGKDFYTKVSISYKEARETRYWLKLLYDTNYIDKKMFDSLYKDCDELLKILGKIQITMKRNFGKK